MKYKNLHIAFLFEIFIGFGTLISIAMLGPKGIAALSIIALRPILLPREEIKDPKHYYQKFYKILSNSLAIIFIMIVLIIVITQFIPAYKIKLPPIEVLFAVILPFFLLTHGVIGLINSSDMEKEKD
jgi:hypothetical protein